MMDRPRLLAWMDSSHAPLLHGALGNGNRFDLIGIGASQRDAARSLSARFDVPCFDDLRQAILHDDAQVLWIVEPLQIEIEERRLIRQRREHSGSGFHCVTCEPVPGLVSEIQRDPEEAETTKFVPLFRRSPGWIAASQMIEQLGAVRSVNAEFRSSHDQGTLFARLFDAMDIITFLAGRADLISARFTGRGGGGNGEGSAPGRPPDVLPGMSGTLGFIIHCGEQRIAGGGVSNKAFAWSRRVTIIGESGCLHVTDAGYEWSAANAAATDESRVCDQLSPGELMAGHILRVVEGVDAAEEPADVAELLSCCEAARLSARTGQSESPGRMLEMLRGP